MLSLKVNLSPEQWLTKIHSFTFDRPIRLLNVCGGHERTISNAGLRTILPEFVKLIPGPGCPVCVCPIEIINQAIQLSEDRNIILTCFGDMINVPANNKKGEIQSLKEARALGHKVIPVSSPLEVMKLAAGNKNKTIVFFVAGFETTMAPISAMIDQIEKSPHNIKFLIAGRKTWPIVSTLLNDNNHKLDGIIAPGHVATIMGSNEWDSLSRKHTISCAVSGFNNSSMLESIYSILLQLQNTKNESNNCYRETVTPSGNVIAQTLINKYFDTAKVSWRGIGRIANSGFMFKEKYNHLNAELLISSSGPKIRKSDTQAGCDCPKVTMGKISPNDCVLFSKACTPSNPIGACMVSNEGACNIWWHSGERLVKQQTLPC